MTYYIVDIEVSHIRFEHTTECLVQADSPSEARVNALADLSHTSTKAHVEKESSHSNHWSFQEGQFYYEITGVTELKTHEVNDDGRKTTLLIPEYNHEMSFPEDIYQDDDTVCAVTTTIDWIIGDNKKRITGTTRANDETLAVALFLKSFMQNAKAADLIDDIKNDKVFNVYGHNNANSGVFNINKVVPLELKKITVDDVDYMVYVPTDEMGRDKPVLAQWLVM